MYERQPNLPIQTAHRRLHMESKDDAIPFPQKAADHATRIVQKMVKVFQAVREAWKKVHIKRLNIVQAVQVTSLKAQVVQV